MTRKKAPPSPSLVRSSAAEYLTFVAATGDQSQSVEMRYEDENVWLTQKMMATLYDVTVAAINQHLTRIFGDRELDEQAVIQQYLITASDGKKYQVKHYALQAIIAVGFKIENDRAVQFRKWANKIVKDYTIQGWVMDVDGLKAGAYLDMAEMQARRRIPMTMQDWEKRLAGFLRLWDREILQDAGKVSAELAKTHAETEFEKYRVVQDRLFESDFDRLVGQTRHLAAEAEPTAPRTTSKGRKKS